MKIILNSNKLFCTLPFFALLFCISSCSYKKAEVVPNQICDTINQVNYETHIRPILNINCVGCHSGSSPSADVALNSKTSAAEAADNYMLYHVVNHTNGYSRMPKNSDKLTDCQIQTIKKWIKTGKN